MVNALKIPIRGCNISVVLLGMLSNLKNHKNGGEWYGIKPSHPMKKRTSKPLTPSMKEGTIEKVVGVTFCPEVCLFNIICFHLKN